MYGGRSMRSFLTKSSCAPRQPKSPSEPLPGVHKWTRCGGDLFYLGPALGEVADGITEMYLHSRLYIINEAYDVHNVVFMQTGPSSQLGLVCALHNDH